MNATMTAPVKKSISRCLEEMKALETFNSKPERIGSPSIGDTVRQGDVYFVCIESLPKGKPSSNRQMAEGTTQGSRHVLAGDVEIVTGVSYKSIHPTLIGPAFQCKSDVEVTHPEHGHKILPAGTCWQTTFQVAFAEEVRRVRD